MREDKSRLQNATLNTIWAIFTQLVIVLLGLLSRKVFLTNLGAELLGVNNLFSDVLMLFSFADLGFGTAIMFSMYQPIAENNEKKVQSMLLFYRTIYRFVILALMIISLGFVPFLPFIKTDIKFNELIIYYLFFQLSNIIEYVWAYRESYVIACQRERELSKWNLIYNVVKNIGQIMVVIVCHNFVAYLLIGLACVVGKKLLINSYILSHYPITSLKNVEQLPKNEKNSIVRKSVALVITKVGNLIINQTDSLIVSYLISVVEWGFASNYLVIKKAIFNVSDKIYSAVLPSMGNLLVEDDKEHHTKVFLKYDFMNAWMHTFFFVAFLSLSNPFIELFFGEKAVLNISFVFIFFFASFIDGLRSPVSVMREAGGSFEQDKWYTILAAFVNIVVSVPLAVNMGLVGVYIGTVCAMIVLHICRTIVLLNGKKYSITVQEYFVILLRHAVVGFFFGVGTLWVTCMLDGFISNKYFLFLAKCILVAFIPNILWLLVYCRNQIMKELWYKFISIIRNKRGQMYE